MLGASGPYSNIRIWIQGSEKCGTDLINMPKNLESKIPQKMEKKSEFSFFFFFMKLAMLLIVLHIITKIPKFEIRIQ